MYRDDKFEKISVPENLDTVIREGIAKGIDIKNKKRKKTIIQICGSMVAIITLFSVFCTSFPALAAKIPMIGGIFANVEKQVSYKGDFSKNAKTLITEAENIDEEQITEVNIDSSYVQTSNGITVKVSEVYFNSIALYLGMSIYSEEGFPEDFIWTKNMEGYSWDYDQLQVFAEGKLSFLEYDFGGSLIEGVFEDTHTFNGIMRIDISHLTIPPTEEEIKEAGIDDSFFREEGVDAEEMVRRADEYNLKVKEALPDAWKQVEVPETFTYELKISEIYSYLFEAEETTFENENGEDIFFEFIRKGYVGEWYFKFDVTVDHSQTQVVEINETNDVGEGIKKVEKTPYEITAEIIVPDHKLDYDYFLVICDENGDLLDYQGSGVDVYQLYGRDTEKVYVYVCDYIEYLDELKGYYWSDDYEEKKKTKTFAQYLSEHALYGTEVEFGE